jgi:hypothetical protein
MPALRKCLGSDVSLESGVWARLRVVRTLDLIVSVGYAYGFVYPIFTMQKWCVVCDLAPVLGGFLSSNVLFVEQHWGEAKVRGKYVLCN